MALLIAGVVFWSIVHLLPSAAPGIRANLSSKLGEMPYKGLFAFDILIALGLIVFGWKSALPSSIYAPPFFGSPVPSVFIIIGIIFLVASSVPNNLKRYIRHPQMTGVLFWSIGHLLANGDSRSLVLFGGLGLWSILEMTFINKRDGAWQIPRRVAMQKDVVAAIIAAAVFAGLVFFHVPLFGVAAIPAAGIG